MSVAELEHEMTTIPIISGIANVPEDTWTKLFDHIRQSRKMAEDQKRLQRVLAGDYLTFDEWQEEMDLA